VTWTLTYSVTCIVNTAAIVAVVVASRNRPVWPGH